MSDNLAELGNEVLTNMFADAWKIEQDETDGSRTYGVRRLGLSLEQMGIDIQTVGACCTEGAAIARTQREQTEANRV